MFEAIPAFFHLIYEVIRHLWLLLFMGWWAFWVILALRSTGQERRQRLMVPAIFTVVGLMVSLMSVTQVYSAVESPGSFSVSLDPCSSWHHSDERADCESDDVAAQQHFASLAVKEKNGNYDDIAFWATWWNVFGDTVSYVQIVLLWLGYPIYLYVKRKGRPQGIPAQVERDFIRIRKG